MEVVSAIDTAKDFAARVANESKVKSRFLIPPQFSPHL